ncbi:MAG: 50S ribosomal protein L20 [Acidobacteria bacterium]|nr:50S ribosomal protein L20 [Acidobacteriota bacterium]
MPRAKRGNKRLQKRKKILSLAKGFMLTKSKLYRQAKESIERALKFAYVGRKLKKRDFRSLWIVRIGAATKAQGLSYSRFMYGLKLSNINLDRKMLADLALNDTPTFTELVSTAKTALEKQQEVLKKVQALRVAEGGNKKGRYSTLKLSKR